MSADTPSPSLWRTLGWAAYLGVSWTWCIGMFLPILLIRDFGWWAFVVFAIPNLIGAAAMGWVLRSRDDVTSIWERHRPAVRTFTLVTILFHFFFLGWIVWVIGGEGSGSLLVPIVVAVPVLIVAWLVSRRRELVASVFVWLVSLAVGAFVMRFGGWEAIEQDQARLFTRDADPSLMFLAPVCVFGFLLCPYLDATFLRARHNLDAGASKIAFGIGFGVVFFSMILLTLGYSAALEHGVRLHGDGPPSVVSLLFVHFVVQALFTAHIHIRAMPGGGLRGISRIGFPLLGVAAIVVGLVVGYVDATTGKGYAGIALGEVIYRGFMAFYGLVFPAYVWVCMIPTRDGHAGTAGERGRRKVIVLLAAVALATPCYWMGFIERQTWWLAPGLGVVLLARLVVMGKRGFWPGEAGEVSARGGM